MVQQTSIDELPGTFGYGAGLLYGLPSPPRWAGQVQPALDQALLLLQDGQLLYGRLAGLDWEGGNVILHAGDAVHSRPIADLRGILVHARTESRPVSTPVNVVSTLHYRDDTHWTLTAHSASADLFGVGFFAVADGVLHSIFVPWRVLAEHRVEIQSGLDDHRRARLQREVAFRRGAEIDRLRQASLEQVAEGQRREAEVRASAYAKAFCEALGG